MLTDLSEWLRELGVPETVVVSIHDAVFRENGIMAKLLNNFAANFVPSNVSVNQNRDAAHALAEIRSPEFETWLLGLPEPSREELDQVLDLFRNVLPMVRRHLYDATKLGPHQRKGGRPKKLDDPKLREKIREEIKSLLGPGRRLQVIYERLAKRYGVSASTIKRIWLEKRPQNGGEEC